MHSWQRDACKVWLGKTVPTENIFLTDLLFYHGNHLILKSEDMCRFTNGLG